MTRKIDERDLYITVLIMLSIIGIIIANDNHKLNIISQDFKKTSFLVSFVIITAISIWGLTSKNERIKTSIRHAVVAFLIAYFAHLDMVFAAFFLVAIFAYFTGEKPTE